MGTNVTERDLDAPADTATILVEPLVATLPDGSPLRVGDSVMVWHRNEYGLKTRTIAPVRVILPTADPGLYGLIVHTYTGIVLAMSTDATKIY